jgi:D-3-phosphoglycerate dehydrogenase
MYHILVLAPLSEEGLEVLRSAPDVQFDAGRWKRADLLTRIDRYDALIVRSGAIVDQELIERAAHLKVIGRGGAGLDGIDIAAATARGVMVMNTPQANNLAMAEHTLALMLALCRQLPPADAAVRRGEWDRTRFPGVQLYGKTLGLVGFGVIGRLVAARALAFGMEVLAYDPYIDDDIARQLHVTVTTLDDLLTRSDFVSLHTALTPDTRRMIGAPELGRLRDGARLVNCASSELLDEGALLQALTSGRLAGAALDGLVMESDDHPLFGLPNVIVTPRLGPNTVEAQRDVSTQIAQQVLDALRDVDYRNVVNVPFIAGTNFTQARPYLELAEQIGALQSQLVGGRVRSVEIEVKGEGMSDLVKPVAVALLKGLLSHLLIETVNYINAPALAAERGIAVAQTRGLDTPDYPNLISCRVSWDGGGQHVVAGTMFGGTETRIVQLDHFRMDARPQGLVLIMLSRDVPGVIGKVGTLLYEYGVNIGEWRLGRDRPGGTALSFVNLDEAISEAGLAALRALPEVMEVRAVRL